MTNFDRFLLAKKWNLKACLSWLYNNRIFDLQAMIRSVFGGLLLASTYGSVAATASHPHSRSPVTTSDEAKTKEEFLLNSEIEDFPLTTRQYDTLDKIYHSFVKGNLFGKDRNDKDSKPCTKKKRTKEGRIAKDMHDYMMFKH